MKSHLIRDRLQLKEVLKNEKKLYYDKDDLIHYLYANLCRERNAQTYKFIKCLRKTEYYDYMRCKKSFLYFIPYIYYYRKKNKLGERIGCDIGYGMAQEGLFIAHTNIIIGSAEIGKNCKLHGQNCIGSGATIGDNCELWVGAKVFGPSKLANNITVAAGAIVLGTFDEEGITIGGVPAKKLK